METRIAILQCHLCEKFHKHCHYYSESKNSLLLNGAPNLWQICWKWEISLHNFQCWQLGEETWTRWKNTFSANFFSRITCSAVDVSSTFHWKAHFVIWHNLIIWLIPICIFAFCISAWNFSCKYFQSEFEKDEMGKVWMSKQMLKSEWEKKPAELLVYRCSS